VKCQEINGKIKVDIEKQCVILNVDRAWEIRLITAQSVRVSGLTAASLSRFLKIVLGRSAEGVQRIKGVMGWC
jgi:hypothetical protein